MSSSRSSSAFPTGPNTVLSRIVISSKNSVAMIGSVRSKSNSFPASACAAGTAHAICAASVIAGSLTRSTTSATRALTAVARVAARLLGAGAFAAVIRIARAATRDISFVGVRVCVAIRRRAATRASRGDSIARFASSVCRAASPVSRSIDRPPSIAGATVARARRTSRRRSTRDVATARATVSAGGRARRRIAPRRRDATRCRDARRRARGRSIAMAPSHRSSYGARDRTYACRATLRMWTACACFPCVGETLCEPGDLGYRARYLVFRCERARAIGGRAAEMAGEDVRGMVEALEDDVFACRVSAGEGAVEVEIRAGSRARVLMYALTLRTADGRGLGLELVEERRASRRETVGW